MLEENKIVDQAQQVMGKLCTIAKTNCEKHFIADQKKEKKNVYTGKTKGTHKREVDLGAGNYNTDTEIFDSRKYSDRKSECL